MSAGILPVELLEEIFSRLEVKSLISLTIICKSWLALISSQSFAKAHLSRYHLNPDTHLLLLHLVGQRTITVSTLNFPVPVTSRIKIPASDRARNESQDLMCKFLGSINGLVCLSRPISSPTDVVIWNPATHKFREIMVPRLNLSCSGKYVAFGYDCVRDDYNGTINHIESLVSIEGMERVSEEPAQEVGQETAIDRNASNAMMVERIE